MEDKKNRKDLPCLDEPFRSSASDPGGRRVLLAEDNPFNRELAVEMLNMLGFSVDSAEDGHAATKAFEPGAYDLILMDCDMPVLDGYEAARRIRAAEIASGLGKTPIVALTGDSTAECREMCLAAGMDDFLGKPFTLNAMREMACKWFGGLD